MACKLAMLLGLTALLTVLMVGPADSVCCHAFWLTGKCNDGTHGTPYCAYGQCDWLGCNCNGGCRHRKRGVEEEARSLLELLRGEQEDTAPEEGAIAGRRFGDTGPKESAMDGPGLSDPDTNHDMKLSKQEALEKLKLEGEVDTDNLPADWFTSMDTNGNGFIDPVEYDEDEAKGRQ
ncbi:uncharacterized protein LOC118418440 [Branchiostoma floridae]|uniref:Uncharacterized protein LOC118418440 n=1 Tax=Branchiostoma floridae TaxID=7739 RepID=A0A9J7LDT5_BRAFL|nr:uncharacterized protein LOC118418440 [Branchiostoma floridae]XP_035680231.1 uncharacterized protein LOC118418440 [Branchiostoma floridae]